MVRNTHERELAAPADDVGAMLDRLGGPDDALWPSPEWAPMVLDRPLAVGATGGHGPIHYRVTEYEPGRRVAFAFEPGQGIDGWHALSVEPQGLGRALLRHAAEARLGGGMRLLWPLAVRWLHDAVVEDLLDRAEAAVAGQAPRPPRWSPWVRLLRPLDAPRTRPVAVPATPLLAGALPRMDWSDAYSVRRRPGTPADPQVWADAIFRDPPRAVRVLLGVRNALVGFVGIARGTAAAFDPVARSDDEVLLGADEQHLDFRASVRCTDDHVVLSTVVRIHNLRGRLYSAVVRVVHPMIVRAMLGRAAHRLGDAAVAARAA